MSFVVVSSFRTLLSNYSIVPSRTIFLLVVSIDFNLGRENNPLNSLIP